MRLKISEAKGQTVDVHLTEISDWTVLQRSFVPETNAHLEEFSVSELSNGMYLLRVVTPDKQTALKIVKVN